MKVILLTAIVLTVVGCGAAPDTPEVVYEKGLDDTGYLNCMVYLLTINDSCRLQRDEDIFEACMLTHHRFCLENNEELKRGGVK